MYLTSENTKVTPAIQTLHRAVVEPGGSMHGLALDKSLNHPFHNKMLGLCRPSLVQFHDLNRDI